MNNPNKKCLANSGGCDTPLTIAADDGLVSVCRLLLDNRADVAFRCTNEMPDGHEFTALLYAAKNAAHNSGERNQSALCQLLLQHDADCNAQDAKGFTPLMWTVPEKVNPTGQIEFARMLLEFGAVVDATDIEGLTALWWACKCCTTLYDENRSLFPSDQHPNALPPCAPFIRLLLNHGAVVDLPPESGSVPSPKAMLERCGLQKLLDNSVIVVSDDSDDAPAVSGHAAKRVRPVAVKCLSSEPVDSHEQQQLQIRKQALKNYRDMLRRRLKRTEDDLDDVKRQLVLSRGVIDAPSDPVVKLEQSDSASDSRDRWSGYCDKCGQLGTLLCCESPGCTRAFHCQCVFLAEVPEGKWVCDMHSRSVAVPRDVNGIMRALLFKPNITDISTVWTAQQCFAAAAFQILDTSHHHFLAKAQARVFAWFDENPTVQPAVFIVKGMPNGHDTATQRRVEAALTLAFVDPNSLSSPSRVIVTTIPDTDERVGLRGQSGLIAAVDIPKFSLLEAYRGRLRLRQQAAQSTSLLD